MASDVGSGRIGVSCVAKTIRSFPLYLQNFVFDGGTFQKRDNGASSVTGKATPFLSGSICVLLYGVAVPIIASRQGNVIPLVLGEPSTSCYRRTDNPNT